jgi:DNA-binding IclR family transcriptional regulator
MTNQSSRRVRRAILQRIADETEETCNLTAVDGIDVVYLDRVESRWPLRVDLSPGSRVPLYCSASGKLFLSRLPPAKRRTLLQSLPLKAYTERTFVDVDGLEAELDRIRATGVGTDNEEYLAGLVCVAVPVVDRSDRHIATIALQAPSVRFPLERAMECVPLLRRAAGTMAATFDVNATPEAVAPKASALAEV